MEFTLYYKGNLKANGGTKDKQKLRRKFHPQLKELWKQLPLKEMQSLLKENPQNGKISIIQTINGFNFAPLVTERLNLIAELKIIFLRPGPPGSIITQSGDIDNHLKTLFDALRVPKEEEIPRDDTPGKGESPFFCLLEDDCLITKVTVDTDRLLVKPKSRLEGVLLIHVKTKPTQATDLTLSLV